MKLVLGILAAAVALLAPATALAQTNGVFFSEYVEGSVNNKALEIYNGTAGNLDLGAAAYDVQIFSNGSSTASSTTALTGIIAPGDVLVLVNATADAGLLALSDQTDALTFNGDDAVALRAAATNVDVIGQIGPPDPGTEWGTGSESTADHTLRRKATVLAGDPNGADAFVPATEWNGFALDTFSGLGSHAVDHGANPAPPTGQRAAALKKCKKKKTKRKRRNCRKRAQALPV